MVEYLRGVPPCRLFFVRKNGSGDDAKTRSSCVGRHSQKAVTQTPGPHPPCNRRPRDRLVLTPAMGIRIIPENGDSLTDAPDASSPNLFGFQMALPSSLIRPTERIAR